jgi:hypothetical protein
MLRSCSHSRESFPDQSPCLPSLSQRRQAIGLMMLITLRMSASSAWRRRRSQARNGLAGGASRIRTLGPALRKGSLRERATSIPGHLASASGAKPGEGPEVRIRLPPAASLRTLGPPRDERPDWVYLPRTFQQGSPVRSQRSLPGVPCKMGSHCG